MINDQAPITTKWDIYVPKKYVPRWSFNISVHNDPDFDSFIKKIKNKSLHLCCGRQGKQLYGGKMISFFEQ